MARRSSKLRLAALALVAALPGFLKRPLYRGLFGYRIGRRVRLGLSVIDARECEIADDVSLGHLNLIIGVGRFTAGEHARVGHLNVIRGGEEVSIGRYAEILRMNEINSIPDPVVVNPTDPRFHLGDGAVVTAGHKIDFTDRVTIGRRTILGGRNSSLWTHNRQRTRPVEIGELTYVGSEIRVAPGGVIPSRCIVGIGAVVTGRLEGEHMLFAGVPARPVKPLSEEDRFLVERKTRDDLPDDI
jgi:acetyltransferase-like isoleucine patch superfamily enzyme